jgi:hypothetical protein
MNHLPGRLLTTPGCGRDDDRGRPQPWSARGLKPVNRARSSVGPWCVSQNAQSARTTRPANEAECRGNDRFDVTISAGPVATADFPGAPAAQEAVFEVGSGTHSFSGPAAAQ